MAIALFIAMAACSPGLNWREVRVGDLTALLPCKPDRATRAVMLEEQAVSMEMAGCEAADALYAVSHIQTQSAAEAQTTMVRLRTASLASVHARSIHPTPNSGDERTSFDLQVEGNTANGSAVQAHFKWMMLDKAIYQLAVYAPHLQAEPLESFLGGTRFP